MLLVSLNVVSSSLVARAMSFVLMVIEKVKS